MTTVIALDSAGPRIGVALLHDGAVLERIAEGGRGTERQLVALVDELRSEAGIARSALDVVGISIGPGAFTGLRVGIATAGGLAQALKRPVVPIGSLEPRAHQARLEGRLLVMLDARKQRVYAAAWEGTDRSHVEADVEPEAAVSWMNGPFRATGAGAVAYRGIVEAAGGVVVPDPLHPGVGWLARLAADRASEAIGPASLVPRYLRQPDAVVNRNAKGR